MAEDQRNQQETSEVLEDDNTEQNKSDLADDNQDRAGDESQEQPVSEGRSEAGDEVSPPAPETAEAGVPEAEKVEDASESASEDSESAPVEEETPTAVESAKDLEYTGSLGFTGEIQGRVVSLEELQVSGDGDDEDYADLQKMYEDTLTNLTEHDIVQGRVLSIGEKDVVIDIGFKSDGIVPRNEFGDDLEAGADVEVFLERIEDHQGQLVLSKKRADEVRLWERIETAFENDQVVEGEIVRRIKGGMIVSLFGKDAFLPGSQIDVRPVRDFDAYLGRRMEFKIVKLNAMNGNVVVSHKALIEKDLEEQRKKILEKMEPGQVLEGTVKNITDFGVFIDLGGVDGLLHITDLSWGRVSHPSEIVDLDQRLNVVVLDYDEERQRISLGLKQLQSHPWEDIQEKYTEGMEVEGKVVSITDYGAFIELEKGIEGLVHISEMSWIEHIKHPTQKVSLGQQVKVKILNIDTDQKKISLGMKQLEQNPWEGLAERYPTGTVLRGTVRNITNFGVFVEVEPGIDGLVHISDLSWTKKIRHPGEVVKKGQELDVVVLDIDEGSQRVSLGHKQIETNPWNQFATAYSEGTDVEGKVVRFVENGLIAELPLEVEGFVPASQLIKSSDHVDNAYEVGEAIDLRVIEFDQEDKKIILSETAKKSAEERARRQEERAQKTAERQKERRDVSKFTKKAASGPTTLGELSGLAELKNQMETQEREEASRTDVPEGEEETGRARTRGARKGKSADTQKKAGDDSPQGRDKVSESVEAQGAEEPNQSAEAEEAMEEPERSAEAQSPAEAPGAEVDKPEPGKGEVEAADSEKAPEAQAEAQAEAPVKAPDSEQEAGSETVAAEEPAGAEAETEEDTKGEKPGAAETEAPARSDDNEEESDTSPEKK